MSGTKPIIGSPPDNRTKNATIYADKLPYVLQWCLKCTTISNCGIQIEFEHYLLKWACGLHHVYQIMWCPMSLTHRPNDKWTEYGDWGNLVIDIDGTNMGRTWPDWIKSNFIECLLASSVWRLTKCDSLDRVDQIGCRRNRIGALTCGNRMQYTKSEHIDLQTNFTIRFLLFISMWPTANRVQLP